MAIRVQHQGAGAGAGIDLVADKKRKYDLQLKRQEKQQDRMFQVGMQTRDAAFRQAQNREFADIQQNRINAENERQDANWARDQKAALDQRNLAASIAQAELKGRLQAGIESGDFGPDDIDRINKALADRDAILADEKADDAQKFDALAQNYGKLLGLAQRQRTRAPEGPIPWEKADPKLQQSLMDSAYSRLDKSGEPYTDDDALALARWQYDNMVGGVQPGGQAPAQPGGPAQMPAAPGENTGVPNTSTPMPAAPSENTGVPNTSAQMPTAPGQGAMGPKLPTRTYGKKPEPAKEQKPVYGSAREAFDDNPEIEARYFGQAEQQLDAQYEASVEANSIDSSKPVLPKPTFEDKLNLAGQMWEQRQKFGKGPTAGQQSPQTAAPGQAGQQGQAQPPQQASKDIKTRWVEAKPPEFKVDWDKTIAADPKNEEKWTNIKGHAELFADSPEIQQALLYSVGPNGDYKNMANDLLRNEGIDVSLLGKIPQAQETDWLKLTSAAPTDQRSSFVNMRNFSDKAPKDVKNAISVVLDPKSNADAKKRATEHLMNRGVNLVNIAKGIGQ